MTTAVPGGSVTAQAGELYVAFLDGDEHRLGALVDLLTPVLWHAARAQGVTPSVAEEAVQNAWLKLVEQRGRINDPRAVLGWLITTVKRECWKQARSQRRTTGLDDQTSEPIDASAAPDAGVILAERQRILWQHVQELSERCRQLLRVVAFVDRPDYGAVAQALGMPIGSIGPTRGRCLAKLRAALANDPNWGQA